MAKDQRDAKKHPIQPVAKDARGILRFKANAIVQHLLDHGGIDMNAIACLDFSKEDRQQFAQLIGYSLDGYSELTSYVDDHAMAVAAALARDPDAKETDVRIADLEQRLKDLRDGLRPLCATLFEVHEDDLKGGG